MSHGAVFTRTNLSGLSRRAVVTLFPFVALVSVALVPPVVAQELPDNETCRFLGPRSEWRRVAAVVHQASPLFGAQEYYLGGDGTVHSVQVNLQAGSGPRELRFVEQRTAVVTEALFEKLCRGDVLAQRKDSGNRPRSCSAPPRLFIANASGEVRSVDFPREGPAEHERAWLEISGLRRSLDKSAPRYDGPYDPDFIPEEFEWWADEHVSPRKQVAFGERASLAEQEAAQRDYEARLPALRESVRRQAGGAR